MNIEDQTISFYGGTYTGELFNSAPSGLGTWVHPDGHAYIGKWVNGDFNGHAAVTLEGGSTYVGGNGFGEIALQIKGEQEHGIQTNYQGDDERLKSRSTNVSNDDGSEFPVHFSDNDRDGKLSSGDKFTIYGQGNSANGPASDGWKLDIQFDSSGDIIGSAKML